MRPAGSVYESVGWKGGVVGEVDAGFRDGCYIGVVDVYEAFVKEGEEVDGVVEDADCGTYPDNAAGRNQLFSLWVVVVFRLLDGTMVDHPKEAT